MNVFFLIASLIWYHTTISVELWVSSEFEVLKLKTCSFYRESLFMKAIHSLEGKADFNLHSKEGRLLVSKIADPLASQMY